MKTALLVVLSLSLSACDPDVTEPPDACTACVTPSALCCDCEAPPPGCGTGEPEDPPPAPVYVSYSITNGDSVRKFCDVIMTTPTNPSGSGAYYSYYLEPSQTYGGYHVNGGTPPFPVTFKVGCWPLRETPESEKNFTVIDATLTTKSAGFLFRNTATGVVFLGSEETL